MTQRARVVQRSQRMVLVLVDGKTRVAELSAKIGDAKLVETALKELEAGGFIALAGEAARAAAAPPPPLATPSQLSQFSTFGPKPMRPAVSASAETVMPSHFSTFGRPVPPRPAVAVTPPPEPARSSGEPEKVAPARRPLPVFKILVGMLALAVLGAAGTLWFYPYDTHRPALETYLSGQFGVPVRIGAIAPRFWPAPALELRQVRFGQAGEAEAQVVLLPDLVPHVRGQAPQRDKVVRIEAARLPIDMLSAWLTRSDAAAPLKVSVRHLEPMLAGHSLGALSGDIERDAGGRLRQANLHSDDRGLRLTLKPTGQALEIDFEANAWKPLPSLALTFNHVQAHGVLGQGSLHFDAVDLRFFDGRYEGDMAIDWGAAPGVAGTGHLHHLNAASLAGLWSAQPSLSGSLSGQVRFAAKGRDAAQLVAALEATADWRVERGEWRGVDLANALRLGRGQLTRGGSTRFERLSGGLQLAPTGARFTDVLLEAGLMQARGQVEIDAHGVFAGRFGVSLARSNAAPPIVLINGRLPSLEAAVQ